MDFGPVWGLSSQHELTAWAAYELSRHEGIPVEIRQDDDPMRWVVSQGPEVMDRHLTPRTPDELRKAEELIGRMTLPPSATPNDAGSPGAGLYAQEFPAARGGFTTEDDRGQGDGRVDDKNNEIP